MSSHRKVREIISRAYSELETLQDSYGRSDRFLREAYNAALASERQHRSLGSRFTRGASTYAQSCDTAARYFAVKWACEPRKAGLKLRYDHVMCLRLDCLYSQAVRDGLLLNDNPLARAKFRSWVAKHGPAIRSFDYSTHIVGKK